MGLLYNYMNPTYNKILSLLSEIKNDYDPEDFNRESGKPDPKKYKQLIDRGLKLGTSQRIDQKLGDVKNKLMDLLKKGKPSYSMRAPRTPQSTPKSKQERPQQGPNTPENKGPRRPPTDRGRRT